MKEEITNAHTTQIQFAMQHIMRPIIQYHDVLGYPKQNAELTSKIEQHRDLCLALHAEVSELLESTPWKPWRDEEYKPFDRTNFMEEVVDCIFFLTSLCENWDVAPTEIGEMLEKKLKENYHRISIGYNKTS